MKESLDAALYLASEGLDAELEGELGEGATRVGAGSRLFSVPGPARNATWAVNVWLEPVRLRFSSLAEGAQMMRALGGSWSPPVAPDAQALSLAERIPRAPTTPLTFPDRPRPPIPSSWVMTGPNEIIASVRCTSPFPNGEATFVEDHRRPPSRAYLKLWEALTLAGRAPGYGDRCVDLGSSPGGWTWALQSMNAWVLSVDKAPLDPRIARLPRVECRRASAFSIDPATVGRIDWVFSDIICYPERLLAMLERWIAVHPHANFVITIKFQGSTDMRPLYPFVQKHGGRLQHLHNNKHELTWIRVS